MKHEQSTLKNCPNCKFWKLARAENVPNRGEVLFGFCRFNPPTLIPNWVGWPVTEETDLCSEFLQKAKNSN